MAAGDPTHRLVEITGLCEMIKHLGAYQVSKFDQMATAKERMLIVQQGASNQK
jgi:hypothetical protein